MSTSDLLSRCRVLPVITVHNTASALELAQALFAGGMHALEITLRTPAGLEAIRQIKSRHPDVLVAAGTVTTPDEMTTAVAAGADFCLSPGISSRLLERAHDLGVVFVPGVATASEVMLGLEYGFDTFKLFPAEVIDGLNLLKSLAGPFPQVRFCPTGGLNPNNYRDYLAMPNVVCIGGSWMVSNDLVGEQDWAQIRLLAAEAMSD